MKTLVEWAIYARAMDAMNEDSSLTEDEAIQMAEEYEQMDFECAINMIKEYRFDQIDAVYVSDDGFVDIEDDFYTEAHTAELEGAIEEALEEARRDDEYISAYEDEVAYAWYHR